MHNSSNNKEKYVEGMNLTKLEHLPQISCYNHNYYVGLSKEIVLGKSDDDNTTEWLIIHDYGNPTLIGYSYTSEDDKLELSDTFHT